MCWESPSVGRICLKLIELTPSFTEPQNLGLSLHLSRPPMVRWGKKAIPSGSYTSHLEPLAGLGLREMQLHGGQSENCRLPTM